MIWPAVAHVFSLPGESIRTNQLKIPIAGASHSLTLLNYRILANIGKKKKPPGVQESFRLGVLHYRLEGSDGDYSLTCINTVVMLLPRYIHQNHLSAKLSYIDILSHRPCEYYASISTKVLGALYF